MAPVRSAVAACSRDGAAQLRGCRLRYQPGVPTCVWTAALGTAKRRAEQPRVEVGSRTQTRFFPTMGGREPRLQGTASIHRRAQIRRFPAPHLRQPEAVLRTTRVGRWESGTEDSRFFTQAPLSSAAAVEALCSGFPQPSTVSPVKPSWIRPACSTKEVLCLVKAQMAECRLRRL